MWLTTLGVDYVIHAEVMIPNFYYSVMLLMLFLYIFSAPLQQSNIECTR